MRKSAWVVALVGATVSCSGPESTSPDVPRPQWATGTDWSGTVTMKTGTVLRVSFHLETRLDKGLFGSTYWTIIPFPARIENLATGVGGFSRGAGSVDGSTSEQVWVSLFARDALIDGAPPACPPVPPSPGIENIPEYFAQVYYTGSPQLIGTMRLICSTASGLAILDSQPLSMQRTS